MNPHLFVVIEIGISLLCAGALILMISSPLKRALEDICPTLQQAHFWLSYTRAMLLLALKNKAHGEAK